MNGRLLTGLRKAMREASKIRSNEATQAALAPMIAAVGAVTLRKLVGEAVDALYDEKGWTPKQAGLMEMPGAFGGGMGMGGMGDMGPPLGGGMSLPSAAATTQANAMAANVATGPSMWSRIKGLFRKVRGGGGMGMMLPMMMMGMMGGGGGQAAPQQPMPMPMPQRRAPRPQMRMPTGPARAITLPSLGSVRRASHEPELSELLNQFKEQ